MMQHISGNVGAQNTGESVFRMPFRRPSWFGRSLLLTLFTGGWLLVDSWGIVSLDRLSPEIFSPGKAIAQIIPDDTLLENSRVEAGCTRCTIEDGTTVGTTLFHSFESFSIPEGGRAFFANFDFITDIISRVTGDSISRIDGDLRASGTANVFLLNPNGIIFGPNSSLNIGGSFVATTADQFNFGGNRIFSATNPNRAPAILNVTAPVGLQFGRDPGAIALERTSFLGATNNTLALLGGDLNLSGVDLEVKRGRLELGSIGSNGIVTLNARRNGFAFDYSSVDAFRDINITQAVFPVDDILPGDDVSVTQSSYLSVGGEKPGRLQLQGRRIVIDRSLLAASSLAGNGSRILLNASESLVVEGEITLPEDVIRQLERENEGSFSIRSAGVSNLVEREESEDGNAGQVRIETPQLTLQNGGQIGSNNQGSGVGSSLIVLADDILIQGGLEQRSSQPGDEAAPSGLFARTGETDSTQTGSGGAIVIESDRLTIRDGGQISASTFGAGDAGNVDIQASESIDVTGILPTEQELRASGIFAQVEDDATGDGGTIRLNSPILSVMGGAQIATAARLGGQGGDIIINDALDDARLVLLSGTASGFEREDNISGLLVSAEEGAEGDGGSLVLNADRLIVEDGARISADNRGSGEGGSATISVDSLMVRQGGEILAASFADDPTEPGFDQVIPTSGGSAGSLDIVARRIQVLDDGEISVRAEAEANAGQIDIIVETLEVLDSSITASAEEGTAGSIDIITTGSEVLVSGPTAEIAVTATGNGGVAGDLTIQTHGLDVLNGAELSVSSPQGIAGELTIQAANIILNRGSLSAETQQTPENEEGANIIVTGINRLVLTEGSNISASALDSANGGNVILEAPQGVIATPENTDSNITATADRGDGGNINITARAIVGFVERPEVRLTNDIDASSNLGVDGTVSLAGIEVDPSRGLVALPTGVVDVSRLIAQQCNAGGAIAQRSDFVITGRGGLVPAPGELLGQALWDDMRSPLALISREEAPGGFASQSFRPDSVRSTASFAPARAPVMPTVSLSETAHPQAPIEAQAWNLGEDGNITLLARTAEPEQSDDVQWQSSPSCTASRG